MFGSSGVAEGGAAGAEPSCDGDEASGSEGAAGPRPCPEAGVLDSGPPGKG